MPYMTQNNISVINALILLGFNLDAIGGKSISKFISNHYHAI